ncbi:hypothetical protein KR032_005515, partial [Drosophila birchii]
NFVIFTIFRRKVRDPDNVVLTPALFRSCLIEAMESFFCEERPGLEIVKFCGTQQRIIFRVPEEFYEMARISIPLIGHYQQSPCHFEVLETSKTMLDFEKVAEEEEVTSCR